MDLRTDGRTDGGMGESHCVTTHNKYTPTHTHTPTHTKHTTGVGAVILNVLYGSYGLRNYVKAHTYIEDDAANVAWTWGQAGLDVAVVTAVVRRHPFALLPFVAVNYLGHSSYPGTGKKEGQAGRRADV